MKLLTFTLAIGLLFGTNGVFGAEKAASEKQRQIRSNAKVSKVLGNEASVVHQDAVNQKKGLEAAKAADKRKLPAAPIGVPIEVR